jgi:hypothetical protein
MNVNILWDRAIGLKNSQPAYSILPGFLNDYLGRILRSLGRSLGSLTYWGTRLRRLRAGLRFR